MTRWLRLLRVATVFAFVISVFCQGTWVLAGTTGGLSGVVSDASSQSPIAGAKVTVTSPSQSASVTTDGAGHFTFLSLAPDTYTISVSQPGYQPVSIAGETVIADQNRTVTIAAGKALQTIGKVTSRAATELVKPGTTADVYSVNATTQDKGAAFGGGGNLNSAWSALAAVPGVFVTPGQAGYIGAGATLSIRGGDYDQIGYEIDGVPVNRAFDSYPSGPASSLGQQELQVYTGAAPPNAEAQGLSGFINQVIKTGSYPASTQITGDIGGPAYYHKFAIETGGATASRNFSYYVAAGGYNQDQRYVDQFNGRGVSDLYGIPIAACSDTFSPALAPSCYTAGKFNGNTGPGSFVLGGVNLFSQSNITDRDSVVNLHVGFPHKNGTKDDVQLLFVNNFIGTQFMNSVNDQGGLTYLNALGLGSTYATGFQYNGATGVPLPANYQARTVVYGFPQAGAAGQAGGQIPVDFRDGLSNDQGIFKLQYTHAIGASALLKLYGYTYYSDYLYKSPNSANINYYGNPADYSLASHTRGVSANFTDQLGSSNVLSLQGAYTTATTLRDNNSQFGNGGRAFAAIVDSSNPLSGLCYTPGGVASRCSGAATVTFNQAAAGTIPAVGGACGAGTCQYLVAEDGLRATYNTVQPKFYSASLTDQWKPTNKLTIDAGIRYDRYEYLGGDTTGSPARAFWYNAYNLDNCVAAGGASIIARAPGAACPAGATPANFSNPSGSVTEAYNEFQPRVGFTYSLEPSTVVRGSYGRFAQAPNSAFQQYNVLQQNAPNQLYSVYGFQKFGFTTPNHTVVPPTSDNLDFSLEHQFGRDTSVKISPFLRTTQNQIQNFYLNQQTGFTSGLNVGHQTSQGIEFELDKGNFGRDGLAAKLSFAYTNSYIKYGVLSNGTSIIDPLNTQIKSYNAYTSFCATHPMAAPCAGGATTSGVAAAPCYTPTLLDAKGNQIGGGLPVTAGCTTADVANPYWNAPVQGLLDPNGNFPTFDYFPAGIGSAVQGYGAPYTATLLVQYKKNRLAITPALQFFAGQRYGAPATTLGVAPDTCAGLTGPAAGDPRYAGGGNGGSGFDYATCAAQLPGGIPDTFTGKFDTIGAFTQPSQFQLHLQLSYDVTKRISVVANLANIVNRCFGGSKPGFTVSGACSYTLVANGATGAVGNTYNPGSAIQPYVATPYEPGYLNLAPFGVFVSARVKL